MPAVALHHLVLVGAFAIFIGILLVIVLNATSASDTGWIIFLSGTTLSQAVYITGNTLLLYRSRRYVFRSSASSSSDHRAATTGGGDKPQSGVGWTRQESMMCPSPRGHRSSVPIAHASDDPEESLPMVTVEAAGNNNINASNQPLQRRPSSSTSSSVLGTTSTPSLNSIPKQGGAAKNNHYNNSSGGLVSIHRRASEGTVGESGEGIVLSLPPVLNRTAGPRDFELSGEGHGENESVHSSSASEIERKAVDLVAHISHEIRTALNAIVSVVPMLQETHLSTEQARLVDYISLSGTHLMSLVNDILEYAKLRSGNVEAEVVPFSLQKEVETAVLVCAPSARNKRIDLNAYCSQQLPREFCGDPLRVRQIIINLVHNALKFTAPRGIVSVRCVTMAEFYNTAYNPTDDIIVTVKDTGIGMDNDAMARVFEPYVQAKADTQRKFGGTGLGLFLVKRLVELIHGTLDASSVVGSGTTFSVRIPNQQDACEEATGRAMSTASSAGLLGTANVLLLLQPFECANGSSVEGTVGDVREDTSEWVLVEMLHELRQNVIRPDSLRGLLLIDPSSIACVFTTRQCCENYTVARYVMDYMRMSIGVVSYLCMSHEDMPEPGHDVLHDEASEDTYRTVLYPPITAANVLNALYMAAEASPSSPLRPGTRSSRGEFSASFRQTFTSRHSISSGAHASASTFESGGPTTTSGDFTNHRVSVATASTPPPHHQACVLCVEDNYVLRQLIYKMLEKLNASVVAVQDGIEAYRAFSEHPTSFDLVLTDLEMSGMGGVEFVKRIRALEADQNVERPVPVVALSGHPDVDYMRRLTLGGQFSGYLMKPVTAQDLQFVLERYTQLGVNSAGVGPTISVAAPQQDQESS
eukprot:PhM_4_TR18822/c2_g1_i1/m.95785